MPPFKRKMLVLIGAIGVGRDSLLKRLIKTVRDFFDEKWQNYFARARGVCVKQYSYVFAPRRNFITHSFSLTSTTPLSAHFYCVL